MSYVCQPPPTVSVTNGMGIAPRGGRAGMSLLVAGNGGIDVVKVRDKLAIGVVLKAAVWSAHLAPKRGSKLGDIAGFCVLRWSN